MNFKEVYIWKPPVWFYLKNNITYWNIPEMQDLVDFIELMNY